MTYGFLINGPYLHFVYSHVYTRFKSNALGTLQKMMLSQSLISATSILLFYTFTPLLKGGVLSDSLHELKAKAWETMCMNWKLWPLVQLINFTMIPAQF